MSFWLLQNLYCKTIAFNFRIKCINKFRTTIGTKFVPPYACLYIDQVGSKFLQNKKFQPLVWFRYIDDIFFIWTYGKNSLKNFMMEFNNCNPNITFTYEFS